MSFSFLDYLSTSGDAEKPQKTDAQLQEDLTSLKQQSNSYARQIQDMKMKMQRLEQLKANVDRQLAANMNDRTTQNQNAAQNATLNIPGVAPGAAPGINASSGITGGVF